MLPLLDRLEMELSPTRPTRLCDSVRLGGCCDGDRSAAASPLRVVAGAIIIGLIAAIVAFGVAQLILATTSSTALRIIIAAAFAAPAAFAGYHVVLGLSHIGGAHGAWQPIFAGVGAIIIAGAALARLATPIIPVQDPARLA